MLQSILSLMLAAVQVLAWNAAPVYLCLESDGSACVDRGPAFCDCCQVDDQSHEGHSCSTGCADHDHEGLAAEAGEHSLSEGPCGCRHEQISDAQAAVKGQDRASFDLTVGPPVVAILSDVTVVTSASELVADSFREIGSSCALAARAGIVLRI